MRCSGPETVKHRTSLGKSTDVLPQKYGCFHRRSPMFLFSRKGFQVPSTIIIDAVLVRRLLPVQVQKRYTIRRQINIR